MNTRRPLPARPALIAALLLFCLAAQAANAPPPATVFARLPALSRVSLSPDARHLAWVEYQIDRPNIVLFGLGEGKVLQAFPAARNGWIAIHDLGWENNQTLLIEAGMPEGHSTQAAALRHGSRPQVLALNLNGGPPQPRPGGVVPRRTAIGDDVIRHRESMARAFPGKQVALYDFSDGMTHAVARVEGADSPPVYYLLDLAKNQADTIGEEYPQLPAATLGKRQEIFYRNRAGAENSAFLTLPPQYQAGKPLPLVVLAGGDARLAGAPTFDHWSQFLATRGYAVLELGLRAATPEDVADTIGELSRRGLADSRRVCIVGRQQGGHTALASAAFLPDQIACAASINGFSELPGQPSPLRSASRIRAQVLLIHSVDNPEVPVAQAHAMMDALRIAQVQHDYHEIKGTDDWLPVTAVRAFVLQALEKFLADNLAARK